MSNTYSIDGMRLIRLDEVPALFMPMESQLDHFDVNFLGCVNDSPDSWQPIDIGNGKWGGMPGPEFCPRLYRGQSKRHEPCLATIYRDKSYIKFLISVAKQLEFFRYCMITPGVKWFQNFEIMGKKGYIDLKCQSQHYEMDTEILDFTRSRDVAEFFARCRKIEDNKTDSCLFELIPKNEFESVMYTANFKEILLNYNINDNFVTTFPSPFLRPYRQKAVGLNLKFNCLTTYPYIAEEHLDFSERKATELLEKFSNGEYLFPNDVTRRVSHKIKNSYEIIHSAFMAVCELTGQTDIAAKLESEAINIGYVFIDDRQIIDANDAQLLEDEWIEVGNEIIKLMKIRPACDGV